MLKHDIFSHPYEKKAVRSEKSRMLLIISIVYIALISITSPIIISQFGSWFRVSASFLDVTAMLRFVTSRAIQLAMGICGLLFWRDPTNQDVCIFLGVSTIFLNILSFILRMVTDLIWFDTFNFDFWGLILSFIVPFLYIMGAASIRTETTDGSKQKYKLILGAIVIFVSIVFVGFKVSYQRELDQALPFISEELALFTYVAENDFPEPELELLVELLSDPALDMRNIIIIYEISLRNLGSRAHDVIQVLAQEFTERLDEKADAFIWEGISLSWEELYLIEDQFHDPLRRTQLLVFLESLEPRRGNIQSRSFDLSRFETTRYQYHGLLIYRGEHFFASSAYVLTISGTFNYETRRGMNFRRSDRSNVIYEMEFEEGYFIWQKDALIANDLGSGVALIQTPHGDITMLILPRASTFINLAMLEAQGYSLEELNLLLRSTMFRVEYLTGGDDTYRRDFENSLRELLYNNFDLICEDPNCYNFITSEAPLRQLPKAILIELIRIYFD